MAIIAAISPALSFSKHDGSKTASTPFGSKQLYFASNRDGDFEIFRTTVDGQSITQITMNEVDDTLPSSSPDGRFIAFVSTREGQRSVWIMRADGSEAQRVADGAGEGTRISWSPDSEQFVCDMQAKSTTTIQLVNADGSINKTLIEDAMSPAWSPDGTKIAFVRGQIPQVFVANSDGTGQKRLRTGAMLQPELWPVWSANGKMLCVTQATASMQDNKRILRYRPTIVAMASMQSTPRLDFDGMVLDWSSDGNAMLVTFGNRTDMNILAASVGDGASWEIAKSSHHEVWACWAHMTPQSHTQPTTQPEQ